MNVSVTRERRHFTGTFAVFLGRGVRAHFFFFLSEISRLLPSQNRTAAQPATEASMPSDLFLDRQDDLLLTLAYRVVGESVPSTRHVSATDSGLQV